MDEPTAKITVAIPVSLIKAAKIYGVNSNETLREVVIKALQEYIKKGGRK